MPEAVIAGGVQTGMGLGPVTGAADSLAWIRNALARYRYLNGDVTAATRKTFLD